MGKPRCVCASLISRGERREFGIRSKASAFTERHDVATLKGDSLERKYRERPFVYFRRILRKPKLLSDSELDDLLS